VEPRGGGKAGLKYAIYCGDCLEVLPKFPPSLFDAVVTDPPMGLSTGIRITRKPHHKFSARTDIVLDFGPWDHFPNREAFLDFTEKWVSECCRVLKPGGAFVSYFPKREVSYLCDMLEERGFTVKDILVHCLANPCPQARRVKFMQGVLFIVWAVKEGAKPFFNWRLGEHLNYIITPLCQGRERVGHPTQKPLKAIKWLVAYLTPPGGLVLDPFLGSGTTMVACIELGRSCVGIEANPAYCALARARVLKALEAREAKPWNRMSGFI